MGLSDRDIDRDMLGRPCGRLERDHPRGDVTSTTVRGQTTRALLALSKALERRATSLRSHEEAAVAAPVVSHRRFEPFPATGAGADPAQALYGRSFGSFTEAARSALALLESHLPGSDIVLGQMSDGDEVFRVLTTRGETSFELRAGSAIPLHASFAVYVATEQRPVLSSRSAEPVFGRLDVHQTLSYGSYVGVPLQLSDGTGVGSLCAIARETGRYREQDVQLLTLMARMIAQDFESDRTERELRRRAEEYREHATTDPLTGVANRRSFMESLDREWQLSRRGTVTSYLLVADVDGLKAANDRFGHAAGDALLQDVARALTGAARVSDAVGRLGGDEFGVILIGCDGEGDASAFCARARDRLAVVSAEHPSPIALSFGFHALADARSRERALELADRAMYRDKALRRAELHREEPRSPDAP
jgi:diguanylate cyclase (GGDEF)-like protein